MELKESADLSSLLTVYFRLPRAVMMCRIGSYPSA
jgi:hypothetical protein